MPYDNTDDLPPRVRGVLPKHAQEIYMKAFNSAWRQYSDPARRRRGSSREETAHRVAWAAVEKVYSKDSAGAWRRRATNRP